MAAARRVTQAADRATEALKVAVAEPSTEHNRRAAECIVQLRKQFKHESQPDWAGRSPEYRDCIELVYRQAGVPSDGSSNLQANLRYHLGNVLRKVAPVEELQALGLAVDGPLARVAKARTENRPPARKRDKVTSGSPEALADAALSLVQALRSMELEQSNGVEVRLRAIIDESLDVISGLGHAARVTAAANDGEG